MIKHLTKRKFISIISLFTAACAVLGINAIIKSIEADAAQEKLELLNLQSSVSLCESIESIESLLYEAAFVSSADRRAAVNCEIAALCASARAELADLGGDTDEITEYLCGVYLLALEDAIGSQRAVALAEDADKLYDAASLACESLINGGESFIYKSVGVVTNTAGTVSATAAKGTMLAALGTVTREEAAKAAADFCGVDAVLLRDAKESGSAVELYSFAYSDISVSVTKRGGLIYSYYRPADCGKTVLTLEDARSRARETAHTLGYTELVLEEESERGSAAYFIFVGEQNSIPCLSDSIEIGVCLEKGTVFLVDASGYILNNCERQKVSIVYDEFALRALAPENTVFEAERLVYAQFGGKECACFEILCSSGGKKAKLYFDSESFEEKGVKILFSGV